MKKTSNNIAIIIPARGGSKGIPRKNLRLLKDNPLIYYSIKIAQSSSYSPDVYISSDDEEILCIADNLGAATIKRSKNLSEDQTTLDPVIFDTLIRAEKLASTLYDIVITLQPTSPLLKVESLDAAINKLLTNKNIDTIISAQEDSHLSWKKINGTYSPNYINRVNRQYLPPSYRETGAFLISRRECITPTSRIGNNIDLYLLKNEESIDIDNFSDWALCEFYLNRKRILFVVTGNSTVGLGHVYNSLSLANALTNYEILFIVDKNSSLAKAKISSNNYSVIQQENNLIDEIKMIKPDIIINDCLDTSKHYITSLKSLGMTVINFEDLGEGALFADLVINAIYPEKNKLNNHYYGPQYFILRDEFITAKKTKIEKKVNRVLLSFGGVDPNNYTEKCLFSIAQYCYQNNIQIDIVLGLGYKFKSTIFQKTEKFKNISVYENISNISTAMNQADIIFTSAGRTIYEVASLTKPCIVLAQNERELSHFFASKENGFINLGFSPNIKSTEILYNFKTLAESYLIRKSLYTKMKKHNLHNGKKTVLQLITGAIQNHE